MASAGLASQIGLLFISSAAGPAVRAQIKRPCPVCASPAARLLAGSLAAVQAPGKISSPVPNAWLCEERLEAGTSQRFSRFPQR
ncbi:hypothetical protein B0J13DRAFT_555393 [Dactylonectria estremocensis]|uniref:Secreted protein n=1 Tax=Dactylonectria estremocensis TaxID=1079267 RepID=A0A9P9EQK2_9HYPO|nr:hypothetical protein B0J13DRAFT_555393 [Dactylonectria estremocensis]